MSEGVSELSLTLLTLVSSIPCLAEAVVAFSGASVHITRCVILTRAWGAGVS